MSVAAAQADWPLPYWPGVVVAHSIYAVFEARRWSNFQKYKEVCSSPDESSNLCVAERASKRVNMGSRRKCFIYIPSSRVFQGS